ncbi:MAG: phosphoserine phosphatase SerB [Nitrospinaceae bacterium]|nr:phosphoserine phosphatase SerB [Nitrospinaceae bacterium]NIR57377.1 phosphoserine phosphatase SerB [Nitrospinaceae bacterium]NIS87829.1 phosphoserine phosphatase SerB [Nitrospinaceae bacterium]NIT84699.1 phosphoserine phosphatase SerB [Nitrospinaceae bacterium]NIU46878.1 phosphoserine phosphatase SerB [Nitrospinaceae bacterium]
MNSPQPGSQVHVHIAGSDRPGILAEALAAIVHHECLVVDIKQFVFNGLLNLSILLESKNPKALEDLQQSLKEYGEQAGMKVGAYPWDAEHRPEAPYKHRLVVTLLGQAIGPIALAELTRILADLDINIIRIEQLDYETHHVLEIVIGAKMVMTNVDILTALLHFKEHFEVDIAVQEDTLFRRNKRLIVLDADMTFLQCEVIDELGKMAGVGERMADITGKAMRGEIDFATALERRVRLLKGLTLAQLEELYRNLPLTPGAEDLVRILQHLNYKIAIVSGGFQFFIGKLKEKYRLDYGFANPLEIRDGVVTGEVEGEVIDALAKERILVSLAEKEGFSLQQVVAVGDGANDIHMLARAGLGIAFNAKPIVQQHAQASISIYNLELILYFLGISGGELKELREVVAKPGRYPGSA